MIANPNKLYENIGPTAWRVAYFRAQTDIKYAREIFNELDAVVKPSDPLIVEYMASAKTSQLAPHFEARYKLINHLLSQYATGQILELAAGLTPRGLEMTDKDPGLQYVELDLPEMTADKRMLLEKLRDRGEVKSRANLHLVDGSALDQDSMLVAAQHFTTKPISIVNEGLLRYLSFDQKTVVAQNVRALLEKFGGAWITSDITLKKVLTHERERVDNRRRIQSFSGIDIEANCFESVAAAHVFFNDHGFTTEEHSFLEVLDELVAPSRVNVTKQEVTDMIKHAVVFVMRLKT